MKPPCFMETLEKSELFTETSEEERRELSESAHLFVVTKNNPIYLPADDRNSVYVLASGRLKLSRVSPVGRELILDLIEPGEIFGESNILDEAPEDILGQALVDSRIWGFSAVKLTRLLRAKPDLSLEMAKLMRARRKKIEDRLESLAFNNVPGRLANLLLHLSKEYGIPDSRGTLLGIELSQKEMSNFIGASRELVSLTLSDFRRQGLIDKEGRRLVICQQQHLKGL